jgi:4a-hydroxytetrahydrobiopterin dehydratase
MYVSKVFRGDEGVLSLEQAHAAAPTDKMIRLKKIRMPKIASKLYSNSSKRKVYRKRKEQNHLERRKLSADEVSERLEGLNGWIAESDVIMKRFEFPNFAASLDFVNKVGALAEAADHHPDIKFGWGYAEFAMTTHDRGGLTEFDFDLARKIDGI